VHLTAEKSTNFTESSSEAPLHESLAAKATHGVNSFLKKKLIKW